MTEDVVTIAESIGLQVDSCDVEELIEADSEKLSTKKLLAEQQKIAAAKLSKEKGRVDNQCSKFPLLK